MNVRKDPVSSPSLTEPKRLLSINEATVYLGIGRSTALSYLEEIGAKRKIGRRTLYDKQVIDNALSEQSQLKSNNNEKEEKSNVTKY